MNNFQGPVILQNGNQSIAILHMCIKMTIIWRMVPEISSTRDRIFCHFGPFFALLRP